MQSVEKGRWRRLIPVTRIEFRMGETARVQPPGDVPFREGAGRMQFGAAAAAGGTWEKLLAQVVPTARAPLGERVPDLGLVFVSNHFEDEMRPLTERVREATAVRTLLGCTGEGVLGPDHEYEREPALSLWLAHLPDVAVRPFYLTQEMMESTNAAHPWHERLQVGAGEEPYFFMLGDPFSVDINALLTRVNESFPQRPVVGGMASGAEAPGQSALVLDDKVYREGVVGVALAGALRITTVVSQGCRPVGRPYVITKAERNIIHQLGGKKPLALLQEIYEQASEGDKRLMQQGLFIGRVINEQQAEFRRGDFLIRNLMGVDQESGALAVGDLVRAGTTVQFHVRDAATAEEDLRAMLTPQAGQPLAGALLFSCNGRGTRMFRHRDHDIRLFQQTLGALPVAGFFCAGELGPIGDKNFIHGHTASLALFHR
jgi:small ligand-binding sensory domain FIST